MFSSRFQKSTCRGRVTLEGVLHRTRRCDDHAAAPATEILLIGKGVAYLCSWRRAHDHAAWKRASVATIEEQRDALGAAVSHLTVHEVGGDRGRTEPRRASVRCG